MPRVKMIFSQSLAEAAERLVAEPGPLTLLVKRGDFSVEHCARARGDMQQLRGARQLRDEDESYIDAPGKAVSAEGRSASHYGRAISCPLPPRPLQVEGFAHD